VASTTERTALLRELVSPELALVDPALARRARMLLGDPPDATAPAPLESVDVRNQHGPSSGPPTIDDAAPSPPAGTDEVRPEPGASRRRSPFPFSFPDDGHYLGVREHPAETARGKVALDPEPVPAWRMSRARNWRRVSTFVPASSAAAATAIFMLQLYLGQGSLA
jgi:hypothetical protein